MIEKKHKIILDISRLYTYISNVAEGVGNTHTNQGRRNMQHKILIRRAIRDDQGRFTGLYATTWNTHWRPLMPTIKYPKTLACVQAIILYAIFSHYA